MIPSVIFMGTNCYLNYPEGELQEFQSCPALRGGVGVSLGWSTGSGVLTKGIFSSTGRRGVMGCENIA
jgi:hypothetical protein